MRRIRSLCCARAASGHATAAPPSVMNSRRFIRSPYQRGARGRPVRKGGRKPSRNHVLGNDHNRNCPSRVLEGARDNIASGDDDIGCGLDQRWHQVVDPLVAGLKTSWNNRKILVFYEPVDA
jgi:hypothetical protein